MDMIHGLYLVEWLYGAPAEQVMAFVDAPTYAHRSPEVEDLALFQIAYPTGYATVHMGWGQGVGGVDASGSTGHIRLRYNQHQTSGFNQPTELYSVRNWERTDHELDNLPGHMDNIARSFTQLWDDFYHAIREKRDPIAPGEQGARILQLALAGYMSGALGRVVTLPLPPDHPVYQHGIAGMSQLEIWEESRTRKTGIFGLRS